MYSDPEERASVNLDHEWSMQFDSTMTELERNVTCQWREGFVTIKSKTCIADNRSKDPKPHTSFVVELIDVVR